MQIVFYKNQYAINIKICLMELNLNIKIRRCANETTIQQSSDEVDVSNTMIKTHDIWL